MTAVLELTGLAKSYGEREAVKGLDLTVTRGEIGLAVPHGWALDGYNTIIVRGGGFADVAKQLAAVFGFAAAFGFLGVRRFRFDLR